MTDNNSERVEITNHRTSGIVPLKEKLAYGLGQMPGTFYAGVMGVIQSFYYAWMGLQWGWIVIAQIIYAIWNMVNDPVFGNRINNTHYYNKKKGEYQRYIPYIKYGAPIFSVAFALVFFPPGAWKGNQDVTIQVWLFVWYLVSQIAFDTMYTIVLCAYVALAPQMTLDQREREKIQLYCTIFGLPAILIGFILPVAFLVNPTAESVAQFQILVIIIAIVGVFPYLILSKLVHEHAENIPEEQTSLKEGLKLAFKNPSFIQYVIYDGISVFILNMLIVSLPFYLAWVLLPLPGFNMLLFWIGPIICLLFSVYIELKIAEKISTKAALSYTLGVLSIGFFVTFIGGLMGNWIFISFGFCIVFLAFAGDFIHHNPMRADTIDYDYWKISGERREGLYAGIGALFSKPMISVALAVPTVLMTAYGLVYMKSVGGLFPTSGEDMAMIALNISMALIPGITALVGFIIWVKFYPLTKDVVIEMKKELQIIQDQKRKEYEKKRKEF